MHYIIEQVDAYLALLHQAREILLNDGKRKSATNIARRKSGVWTNSKKAQTSSDRTAGKIDGAPQRFAGRVSSKNRVVSTTPPKGPLPNVLHREPTATMSSDERNLAEETVKRVPAQRRTTFNRFASTRTINSIKQDSLKPTTALSHPIRSNVVVISAEQLRLERERLLKPPAVVRPRSPGSGATGRLAFDALFGQ
jgi:hypothetical protein